MEKDLLFISVTIHCFEAFGSMESYLQQMPYILAMTNIKIALVACVKQKQDSPCQAKDMYVSEDFKAWMKYAKAWGADKIFINTAAVENEFSSDESQQTNEVNSSISRNLPLGTLESIL